MNSTNYKLPDTGSQQLRVMVTIAIVQRWLAYRDCTEYRSLHNPCNTEKHWVDFHIWLRLHSHCTKINFHIYIANSVSVARIM